MSKLKTGRTLFARVARAAQLLLVLAVCGNCEVGPNYSLESGGDGGTAEARGTGAVGGLGALGGGAMAATSGRGDSGGMDGQLSGAAGEAPDGTGGTSEMPAGTGGETTPANGGGTGEPSGLELGAACTSNTECRDGNCVDGVCCEGPCTGCNACSGDLTGKADGVCAPVLTGEDPHDTCDDETASNPCGNDGACDGAGQCRKVGRSQVCAPAGCAGDSFQFAATCDGNGKCTEPTTEACAPYPCTATGCAKACTAQADCGGQSYCKLPSGQTSGTCTAKNPNGTEATQTFECASGVISDGVCCDKTCSGCNSCLGAPLTSGAKGQCVPVLAGQLAHNACAASGSACGLDGTCDGAGSCRSFPREGESCGGDANNRCITAGTCRSGSCQGVQTKSCPAPTDQCRGAGTCDPATGNCSYSNTSGGSCDDGNACTQTDTCQSGTCVGSNPVSCSAPTCKVATCNPSNGTCSTSNAPNTQTCNDNNGCTDNDHCQDGTCTGTPKACSSPPPCKVAAGATCSGGTCSYSNSTDGTSDSSCPSGTQRCFGGGCVQCTEDSHCSSLNPACNTTTHKCVQCTANSDCSLPTPSCNTTNNTCVCRQKSSSNRLTNPGFDQQGTGWLSHNGATNTPSFVEDVEGCPGSKALTTRGGDYIYQCVTANPGENLRFGGKVLGASPTYMILAWYDGANCGGNYIDEVRLELGAGEGWRSVSGSANVPSGVKSAKFTPADNLGFTVDQVFVNPSSASF